MSAANEDKYKVSGPTKRVFLLHFFIIIFFSLWLCFFRIGTRAFWGLENRMVWKEKKRHSNWKERERERKETAAALVGIENRPDDSLAATFSGHRHDGSNWPTNNDDPKVKRKTQNQGPQRYNNKKKNNNNKKKKKKKKSRTHRVAL